MQMAFFNAEYAEDNAESTGEIGFPHILCLLCASSVSSALKILLMCIKHSGGGTSETAPYRSGMPMLTLR